MPQLLRIIKFIAIFPALWLAGCANLPYYTQAVSGHLGVMWRAKPIDTIIADPEVDPKIKQQLSKVLSLRKFASSELGLPDNKSYTYYADLQRPYVVWNVFAAPELSFKLKKWCFIKAGCVSYRGFFSKTAAEQYAATLRDEGYDVFVGGVRAYSTLGWFKDPVLNTFVKSSETGLASLIFHELAHQVMYLPGDTVFNESFATAVEHEGIRRWMQRHGKTEEQAAFEARQARKTTFANLILEYRKRLKTVYATSISDDEKRVKKAQVFDDLRSAFNQLKAKDTQFSSYDRWFAQELNNARLATIAIYTQLVPEFQALLAWQDGDMSHFFEIVKEISQLTREDRAFVLQIVRESAQNSDAVGLSEIELH